MGNSRIKILAIDDKPDNLITLKAILKDAFPDVITLTALDGQSGLKTASAEDPDVILLDIVMPGMDGFEVCKKLKSDRRLSDIPVVFITAQKGDKENRIRALEVGADALLAKPIDENELTAQIRAMIKIKWANIQKRSEKEILSSSLQEKSRELKKTYIATLNLLEDLARENEARKKNEQELKKSEASLADIFHTVNDGLVYANFQGDILAVNSSFERILGVNAGDIIGKNTLALSKKFLNPANLKKVVPVLKKIMDGKDIKDFQFQYMGKTLEINVTANKLTQSLTGVIRDITERVEAEKKISMLAHAITSISECISITDMDDNIAFINNAFLKTYQYEESDLIGRSIKMVRSPNNPPDVLRSILPETLHGGWHGELLNLKKDGTEFPVALSSSIIYDDNRVPIALIGIATDITERKKIESQVIQSERLSALGEMSAGMAHEINQPLNTLSILFDNILYEAKENHAVSEEYLTTKSVKIFENILRIRNLIDHVRDFSRSQEGLILNLFDTNQSVLNALSMVSEQFKIAGIEIITKLDEDVPQIKGNTYKFEQVVLNLISNARDALLDKKNHLKENFQMSLKIKTYIDKKQIYLEVKDNGMGIKEENIDKILQPFFTTKEAGKGTGLGLSISYGLVQELKGKIEVQSKHLIGTTILISIPVST